MGHGKHPRVTAMCGHELAGFVHEMDNHSARVRHDYPKHGDPWSGLITHAETKDEA